MQRASAAGSARGPAGAVTGGTGVLAAWMSAPPAGGEAAGAAAEAEADGAAAGKDAAGEGAESAGAADDAAAAAGAEDAAAAGTAADPAAWLTPKVRPGKFAAAPGTLLVTTEATCERRSAVV